MIDHGTAGTGIAASQTGAANPFGVPLTVAAWRTSAAAIAGLVDIELGDLDLRVFGSGTKNPPPAARRLIAPFNRAAQDLLVMEATGRWRVTTGYRAPTRLVPGDVLGLRALAITGAGLRAPVRSTVQYRDIVAVLDTSDDTSLGPEGAQLAALIDAAECYWLPAGAESAVLDSEPPDGVDPAELRLPHGTSAVSFARPPVVDPGALLPTELLEDWRTNWPAGSELPWPFSSALVVFQGIDPRLPGQPARLVVEGVALAAADDDGTPADRVLWAVRVDRTPETPTPPARTLIPGSRAAAGWRNVLGLLTAVIAWGDWVHPAERVTLPARPTRNDLRGLRHGRTRRAEEAGGLAWVRVLDTRRRPPNRHTQGDTHASPITHIRRGHFARYRHGSRDDWHYETHWIPPLVVNPAGKPGPLRIYRLPLPPRQGSPSLDGSDGR